MVYIAYVNSNDEMRYREAGITKTGPNDARRIVWALGKCFFFLHVFLLLTNVLHNIY